MRRVSIGQLDSDGDGLTDQREAELGTNPYNPDTDGDRSWDGVDVQQGTNPLIPDTDSDGLLDGYEAPPCPVPLNPDSDGNGIIDGKDLDPCDANNPALTPQPLVYYQPLQQFHRQPLQLERLLKRQLKSPHLQPASPCRASVE